MERRREEGEEEEGMKKNHHQCNGGVFAHQHTNTRSLVSEPTIRNNHSILVDKLCNFEKIFT